MTLNINKPFLVISWIASLLCVQCVKQNSILFKISVPNTKYQQATTCSDEDLGFMCCACATNQGISDNGNYFI